MKNIDWEAAINNRRSIRSYETRPVEQSKMELLVDFIKDIRVPIGSNNIQLPFKHNVEILLFKANPDKRLYTVFSAPPDGAAFIAETDICSISKAGFVGQILVLFATALGLATCWYGHYSLAELERILPQLRKDTGLPKPKYGYGKGIVQGRRAICITPLGYWQSKGVRLVDRVQTSLLSHKRKTIGAFLEDGISEDELPPELLFAFDLARKAPSAANSQFWRFKVSSDFKTVSIARPVGYKHLKWEHPDVDIGICACHFWLGLMLKGIGCRVSLNKDQGRALWQFEL
jgi:nitroreductase